MEIPEIFWLMIIVLCFLNFIFVLAEVAITEAHKSQIEKIFAKEEYLRNHLLKLINEPRDYLTSMQIGSISCNIIIGIIGAICLIPTIRDILDNLFRDYDSSFLAYDQLIATCTVIFLTLLLIQFTTILSRRLATHNPTNALKKSLRFIEFWKSVSLPFIAFFRSIANNILMLFDINPNENQIVTEDEVKDLIEKATVEGTFEKVEQDIVDRIFHMSDQTVYALMTPRTSMEWLDIEDPLEENLSIIKSSNQSFFIVGKDNLDEIIGIIYAKDIINALLSKQPIDLSAMAHKPIFVPRAMESFKLLDKFRNCDSNEAIVLDEYGGVVGFITILDIVDEVLGDISKTSLETPPQMQQQDENTYILDGLFDIDDFKERFQIDRLPREDHGHYKTMGGFLTSYFGYLPKVGETRIWNNYSFEIMAMEKNRIGKIKLIVM